MALAISCLTICMQSVLARGSGSGLVRPSIEDERVSDGLLFEPKTEGRA